MLHRCVGRVNCGMPDAKVTVFRRQLPWYFPKAFPCPRLHALQTLQGDQALSSSLFVLFLSSSALSATGSDSSSTSSCPAKYSAGLHGRGLDVHLMLFIAVSSLFRRSANVHCFLFDHSFGRCRCVRLGRWCHYWQRAPRKGCRALRFHRFMMEADRIALGIFRRKEESKRRSIR